MPKTRVRFWGVRGSIPAPGANTVEFGGNTSCVEVRVDDQIIILDAGSGIRPLGLALNAEFKNQPLALTLLITHTHWDHIQGLPFFAPAYCPQNKITILGIDDAPRDLKGTLSGQMDTTYFPVTLQDMAGNISIQTLKQMEFCLKDIPVKAHLLNHPGTCTGYRIGRPGSDLCYLPDVELFKRLRPARSGDANSPAAPPGHREQDEALIHFIRDAELLVLDAQYTAAEYEEHIGWGHSCMEDSVAFALQGNVKRLVLFHHDPDHSDDQIRAMVDRAHGIVAQHHSNLRVEAAKEGAEITLGCQS